MQAARRTANAVWIRSRMLSLGNALTQVIEG